MNICSISKVTSFVWGRGLYLLNTLLMCRCVIKRFRMLP